MTNKSKDTIKSIGITVYRIVALLAIPFFIYRSDSNKKEISAEMINLKEDIADVNRDVQELKQITVQVKEDLKERNELEDGRINNIEDDIGVIEDVNDNQEYAIKKVFLRLGMYHIN